ncbi:hypothetical protein CC2G_005331 [Coprinopsis cinerea AmutBmut pab1-1]|nr:hypothetical protein CC2G_005331 [Coprinopsis cinerea AmutBmut pab1-1]
MKNTSSVWMNQACAPCSVQSGSRDFSSVPVILADGIWGPPHQRSPPRSQTHGDNELLSSRPTRIQCQRNHYVTKSQNILHGLFWAPISRFKSFHGVAFGLVEAIPPVLLASRLGLTYFEGPNNSSKMLFKMLHLQRRILGVKILPVNVISCAPFSLGFWEPLKLSLLAVMHQVKVSCYILYCIMSQNCNSFYELSGAFHGLRGEHTGPKLSTYLEKMVACASPSPATTRIRFVNHSSSSPRWRNLLPSIRFN